MSEAAQNNKADTRTSSVKAKVEKEPRHLQTLVAVDADLADPTPDELLANPSGGVTAAANTNVLSREPSTIAQRAPTSGTAAPVLRPVPVPAVANKNFATVPARTAARAAIQTKLTVGAAHDPYEEEADQVAEQVMRLPDSIFTTAAPGVPNDQGRSIQRVADDEEELQAKPLVAHITPLVQRAPITSKDEEQAVAQRVVEEEEELQTKRVSVADSFEVGADFEGRLAATRGGGTPLPDNVRSFMEPRFGADFSNVRVHADGEAATLNQQVSAQAFTLGSDIFLGAGRTDLASESGKQLLAHELTHVVQQGGALARKPVIRRAVDTAAEEPPLSAEAAVAEAAAEVSDVEVEQESVQLDATPIELPADDKIEGAEASTDGGGATAAPVEAAAPTPPAAEASISATDVATPLAETATPVSTATEAITTASALPSASQFTETTATASPAEALPAIATATEPALAEAAAATTAVPATPIELAATPTAALNAEAKTPAAQTTSIEPAAPIEQAATPTAASSAEAKAPAAPIVAVEPAAPIEQAATPTAASSAEAKAPATQAATVEPAAPIEQATQTSTADQPPAQSPAAPARTEESPTATSSAGTTQPATISRPEDEDKKLVRRSRLQRIIQRVVAAAPRSPAEDPAFQAVAARSRTAAQQEKAHEPATVATAEAQAAADPKGKDVEMAAQSKQVAEMRAQPTGAFNADVFKQKLFEKIKATAPQTLKEADDFKRNNKLGGIKQSVSGEVKQQKEQAEGALEDKAEQAPDKSGIPAKEVTSLEKTGAGPQPLDIGAPGAAPKPRTDAEVATPLQQQSAALDQQMAQGNVTEEQLQKSNEPAFQQALQEKKGAQENAQTAPGVYRQDEQAMLNQAQTQAQATAETKSQETRSEKEQLLAQVFGLQGQTKGADESKRQAVSAHIADLYLSTKKDVETILNSMDGEVDKRFSSGADAAKQAFEDHVDRRMSKYKWDRYLSSWDGPALWIRDQFAGLPAEVNVFYVEGRNFYLAKMDACLTGIANYVAAELTRAKQRIAAGQQAIGKYVAGLSPELQQVGREAAQQIQGKFNELGSAVDNKQEELIDSLAQSYHEKLQEVDSRIEEMKQANSGLVNKAAQAIGGVIKTIQELGQLLASALQRAAGAIGMILQDPIKFLGNLIKGVAQGLQNFGANILKHLQTGLIGWLTGSLGGVISTFPKSFTDLPGILSMVLEILGLTYAQIRGKVVKAIGQGGETAVNALEKAWEIFQIIRTQGLGGLWQFIKDMIGDLKAMVIDQIQSILVNEVIQAGIQWIVGLLGGPAGAFIKAVQAIIKIVTWFINNASRLIAFVNSVLDSITSIARGDVGGAAKYIENTLAKALPLVIGFLAELLGLGGVARKVQGIIAKIRAPIDKAIEWIVKKAVAMAKKILAKLSGGGKKDDEKASSPEVQKRWDEGMVALGQLKDKSKQDPLSKKEIDTELAGIKSKYQFKELKATHEGEDWAVYADMNPKKTIPGFEGEEDGDAEGIKKAVSAAGGVVNFMKAMAGGQTIDGINRAKLEKVWSENQTIKDWLKDKFRDAAPGNHEWIPSNLMMDVINRATSIVWGIEAANWIDLQHELRTDTSWVIFSTDYSSKRINGQLVLQGHPGAIYVRRTNDAGEEYLQPQTANVNKWHDALRDKFTNNTKAATVLGSLRTFFGYTVWDGKSLPGNLYPEHRDSVGNLLDMNALKAKQQTNFDQTQTMFGNLMQKYS